MKNALHSLKQAGDGPSLTKKQWEELEKCARDPQPNYGSARVRTQNLLIEKGLLVVRDKFGVGDRCFATDAGKDALRRAGVKLP